MTVLPHLAARLFGVPLAIHRPKLDVILSVLGARIGLADLAAPVGYTPAARAPGVPPHHTSIVEKMAISSQKMKTVIRSPAKATPMAEPA